ncbi:MAG TPA: lipid-binding SYLF domain-containing protein [Bryobacteraceae bacterium]|jgi:lipid-binding SYLF domain-containing protein|nr:lipid-binding SYLF domain-containing protein [Bryobacteraceae bacterium]
MKGIAIAASFLMATSAFAAGKANERLADAATVFSEIMQTPDKGIPQDLLAKADCVVIIPGLKKGAFLVGAEYGRGFAECRKQTGTGWSAPAAVRMEGGSFGFQLGGSDTDMVLLVMNRHGMTKLTEDKFTVGADASVAAGPVGRTANASTDAEMTAEILAWSRSKGLFAGISLKGATLRPAKDWNQELYGKDMTNREILLGGTVKAPPEAHALISELDRYSGVSNADRVGK